MIFVPWFGPAGDTDPYWANVVLLLQGGTGTTLQDLSDNALTATANADAAWDGTHQVMTNNAVLCAVQAPDIDPFQSFGAGSLFARDAGEDFTIECYVYWTDLENTAPSAYLWNLTHSSIGRVCELGLYASTGRLRFRVGTGSPILYSPLPANALHFVQFTVIGDTYFIDVNGTEVDTGSMTTWDLAGTYSFYAATSPSPSAGPSINQVWVTPLRVTKGIARARGSVPATPFPIA